MKVLAALIFSLLSQTCNAAVGASLHGRPSGDRSVPALDCKKLLTALMGVPKMRPLDDSLTGGGRTFLNLIELGLGHLGPEIPLLVKSLQQILASESPASPFLNMSSPLALALEKRTEVLLPDIGEDWQSIRSAIAAEIETERLWQYQKGKDQVTTSSVEASQDVVVPVHEGKALPNQWQYIGETKEEIIFGTTTASGRHDGLPTGRIFSLSRVAGELKVIGRFLVHDSDLPIQWMKQGLIYGFAYKDGTSTRGFRSLVPLIFQLDPETKKVKWSEPWMGEGAGSERLAFRIPVTNEVVGIQIEDSQRGAGSVYVFDYAQLRFIKTDLTFDESKLPHFPGVSGQALKGHTGVARNGQAIKIGRFFKTDGRTLAVKGNGEAWRRWTSHEGIVLEKRYPSDSKIEISIYESDLEISAEDFGQRRPEKRTSRDPIKLTLSTPGRRETIQSVNVGKSILYISSYERRSPIKIQLIDRQTWTATDVEVVGGSPAKEFGKWQFIRNQSDEILLKFDSDSHEVSLWKYNPQTQKFDLQLHDSFDGDGTTLLFSNALIDYDSLKVIAWVYQGPKSEPGGMRARLPVTLSRDGSPTMDGTGGVP